MIQPLINKMMDYFIMQSQLETSKDGRVMSLLGQKQIEIEDKISSQLHMASQDCTEMKMIDLIGKRQDH
jgi:hypothetical protein